LQLKHDSPEARGDYGSGNIASAIQTVIPDSPRERTDPESRYDWEYRDSGFALTRAPE